WLSPPSGGLLVLVRAAKGIEGVIRRELPRHVLEVVFGSRLEPCRQSVESLPLRRKVALRGVRASHNQRQRAECRIVELVLLEERIKRAVVTMMPQLHGGDIIGNRLLALGHRHHLPGGNEEEHRLTVDKPTNQPWARNAIDTRPFSGHPFHGLLLLCSGGFVSRPSSAPAGSPASAAGRRVLRLSPNPATETPYATSLNAWPPEFFSDLGLHVQLYRASDRFPRRVATFHVLRVEPS